MAYKRKLITVIFFIIAIAGKPQNFQIPDIKTTPNPIINLIRQLQEKPFKEVFAVVKELNKDGWFTVDLKNYCNRDYATEWIGGGYTLNLLKHGRKIYYGVPFEIVNPEMNNNKSCIMLYSEKFPSFPENVSIKINKKTNVLYFLHGCAYANFGDRREYRIYYKDNTHKSITLIPTGNVATGQGENIQDWFFSPVIEGPDVKYVPVPVKENPTEITDLRFIYILEWKNPYPEKEIDSIELISGKGQTIIFVFGITGNF